MRKEKVISHYGNMSDFELSTIAGRIVKAMQSSGAMVYFPNPNPDTSELEVIANDYIEKHEIASRRGSALEISQKNERRQMLLHALKNLANYVNDVADGNLPMLLSTGMILANQGSPLMVPLVTERIQLRDGRLSGQIRLEFSKVGGAWEYEVELGAEDDEGNISFDQVINTTSSRGNVLSDLTPGIKYHVRVRARNGRGIGDWSAPVSLIAR